MKLFFLFGSHDLLGLKNVLGRFGTTRFFGSIFIHFFF